MACAEGEALECLAVHAAHVSCYEDRASALPLDANVSNESKDGEHIGDLSFKGLGPDGAVEIGYGISEVYQGNGFAAEAVDAAVKWALRQPGIRCVEAETDPDNRASQRVLEKCGFLPTGVIGEEGPRFIRTNG